MLHIFVYEDNPVFGGPLPFRFLERWVNRTGNHLQLFPLRPVERSCELAGGGVIWVCEVELSKRSSPYPGRKLKQLECCQQNTYEDMVRDFKKTFMFGFILTLKIVLLVYGNAY